MSNLNTTDTDDEFAVPLRPDGSEDYRKQKLQANWVNMTIALLACVALMVVALMIVPRPKGDPVRVVDSVAVGQSAQQSLGWNVAYVDPPEGWSANEAHVRAMGPANDPTWYASYLGPDDQWISVRQSHGDEVWQDSMLDGFVPAGTRSMGGVEFEQFDNGERSAAFTAQIDGSRVVIISTAAYESVDVFAQRIVEKLQG